MRLGLEPANSACPPLNFDVKNQDLLLYTCFLKSVSCDLHGTQSLKNGINIILKLEKTVSKMGLRVRLDEKSQDLNEIKCFFFQGMTLLSK